MNWGSVDAFLDMGGKGLYVWGSYLVTVVLFAIEVVLVRQRRRSSERQIRYLREIEESQS